MATYGYNKDTDYKKLMDEAVARGDMARAAIYEQQRNEKIAGEGIADYNATSMYRQYLPDTYAGSGYQNPYMDKINAAIEKLGDTSALRKTYMEQAKRQTEDSLGAYAQQTGGVAGTAAVAAATQAGDNFRAQLPAAEMQQQQAYASALMSAAGQASSDYSLKINEAMNRWQTLGYADDMVNKVLGVAIGTPTGSQSYQVWQQAQAEKEFQLQQQNQQWSQQNQQWSQQQQVQQQAYNRVMDLLAVGTMPPAALLEAAGIDAASAQQMLGYYKNQQTQQSQSDAYNRAMVILQTGNMPSQDALAAAGLSVADAQLIANYYRNLINGKVGGSSSGGGSGGSRSYGSGGGGSTGKPLTQSAILKMTQAYDSQDWATVRQLMESYEAAGYSLDAFTNIRDISKMSGGGKGGNGGNGGSGGSGNGITSTQGKAVLTVLQAYANQGATPQQLKERLAEFMKKGLSDDEAMAIAKALGLSIGG